MNQQPNSPSSQPGPQDPRPRKRFVALAWTSIILGIVGVAGSPILIFNNLTAIAAAVGVILGIIALFGSKKILAGIGVVLSVVAIVLTVIVQDNAVEEIFGSTNEGSVSDGQSGDQQANNDEDAQAAPAQEQTPTWGKRYTWDSGLAVEVSKPADCTPSEWASPSPQDIERAAKVTVTVINGTESSFDAGVLAVGMEAQFDGRSAEEIFDQDGPCGAGIPSAATVLPGKTFTFDVAYALGAKPGELQIVLQPEFGADKAAFVGKA